MIDYGLQRGRDIVRQSLQELRAMSLEIDNANVDDALSYFGRQEDHQAVRDKMIERFAVGITKTSSTSGYETYSKSRLEEQIQQGEYEVLTSGVGPQVISSLANLFTLQTQSWDWVDSLESKERNEAVVAMIKGYRENGQFQENVTRADQIAVAVDSGPLMVSWQGGGLRYMALSPSCMYAIYHDEIVDEGIARGVDYTDLEDATVVIIRVSDTRSAESFDPSRGSYLAIFGRSEDYPNGRNVYYTANNYRDIPAVGNPDAIEYYGPDGGVANPLSLLANKHPNRYIPEYPFIILRGGYNLNADTLLPVTTSLWESCLEIDLAFSRLLKDSLNAAKGVMVITSESGDPLPRSLEAYIALHGDQSAEVIGRDAGNAVSAMNVVRQLARSVAEGFHVPGYQVMAESTSIPESGVALTIRTQPLIDHRERRVEMNRMAVGRLFEIEKGLHELHSGKKPVSDKVRQIWVPGRYVIPESRIDKANRLEVAMRNGMVDYVRAVRDYHDFSTDEEAMAFIDEMEARKTDYPAPGAGRLPEPVGLTQDGDPFLGDNGEDDAAVKDD